MPYMYYAVLLCGVTPQAPADSPDISFCSPSCCCDLQGYVPWGKAKCAMNGGLVLKADLVRKGV